MKNPPCTQFTQEEESALMSAFPLSLTKRETETARSVFPPIVFYRSRPDRSRDCWCSSCHNRFKVPRKGHADFFNASHKRDGKRMKSKCPNCQKESTILAADKFSDDFKTLFEEHNAVRLTEWNGWLLVQAGTLIRSFHRDTAAQKLVPWLDVQEELHFYESRRYAFRPGRRIEWQMWFQCNSDWCGQPFWHTVTAADYRDGFTGDKNPTQWKRSSGIGEAHPRKAYESEAAYYVMGMERMAESSLRYCGYNEWFLSAYGAVVEDNKPRRYAWLCTYLAEFCRRPQMEFLVKLGYSDVISDLVTRRTASSGLLNWRAKNPAAFFRMSKTDFNMFRTERCNVRDLKDYHSLRDRNWVADFQEYVRYRGNFGNSLHSLCDVCEEAGVSLAKGGTYIQTQAGKLTQASVRRWTANAEQGREEALISEAITTWKDYLGAAKRLEYDLAREDVLMPKDLAERHDAAVQTVHYEEDRKEKRKYARLYKQLVSRYEYAEDGMRIMVPTCSRDIINEGKALHHCVGSYAPRHVKNMVTILFLRMDSAPDLSYVTIEMTVDKNPANLSIRQIHGYRNERDGAESPRKTHEAFLSRWMDWVHSGSPRDREGRPAAPDAQRVRVSA